MSDQAEASGGGDAEGPLRLRSALYKYISVTTVDGSKYEGWLKTIDPVTGSLVIVNFENNAPDSVDIIMGNAYKDGEILKDRDLNLEDKLKKLFSAAEVAYSEKDLLERKERVKSWLVKNRLPVVESEENSSVLVVADVLKIEPPYGDENCISSNTIILGKIKNLLQNVPDK